MGRNISSRFPKWHGLWQNGFPLWFSQPPRGRPPKTRKARWMAEVSLADLKQAAALNGSPGARVCVKTRTQQMPKFQRYALRVWKCQTVFRHGLQVASDFAHPQYGTLHPQRQCSIRKDPFFRTHLGSPNPKKGIGRESARILGFP